MRNQTRGRKTLCLDYEAYEEMALEQMESLADQALQRFQIRDVAVVHRLGRLEIGETSVLIAVANLQEANGVSVGAVADALHVSSAFVASETGKLAQRGLLDKRTNPRDRRGVLVSVSPAGRQAMAAA